MKIQVLELHCIIWCNRMLLTCPGTLHPLHHIPQHKNFSPRQIVNLTSTWSIHRIEELEVEPHEGNPKPTVTRSGGLAATSSVYDLQGFALNGPQPQSSYLNRLMHTLLFYTFLFQESNLSAMPSPP